MQNKTTKINSLDFYRRRMGFNKTHVARLLGDKDDSRLAKYERGRRVPSLRNAFRLGIILRVPIEFLFPLLYDSLRNQIRADEERLAQPTQATLF